MFSKISRFEDSLFSAADEAVDLKDENEYLNIDMQRF